MVNRLDNKRVRANFERAAATYAASAVAQRAIEDRLLERIVCDQRLELILDLGCGPGRGSAALGARFPSASIIAIDIAHAMLERVRRQHGVCVLNADARTVPLQNNSVDLVYSNLMLQWIENPAELFDELRRVMRPGAALVFSSLGPDSLAELKQSFATVDSNVHVHDFIDMHDLGDELVAAGFSDPVLETDRITIEYRSPHQLMRDLKETGARNASNERQRGLSGKRRFQRMLRAYERLQIDGYFPASLEVIFAHARAPDEGHPRRTADGFEASITVEALRATINKRR